MEKHNLIIHFLTENIDSILIYYSENAKKSFKEVLKLIKPINNISINHTTKRIFSTKNNTRVLFIDDIEKLRGLRINSVLIDEVITKENFRIINELVSSVGLCV